MAQGLRSLGIAVDETPDGAVIHGGTLLGGTVKSASDHRCAMSFAVAGLIAREQVRIIDCANVATSFPGFIERATAVGFAIATLQG